MLNRTLTSGALLGAVLLGACATTQTPPPALVEARSTVRSAEQDPLVARHAPLELKKAADSLTRANALLDQGESLVEVGSVAYVAQQEARAAMAIAQAKGSDEAIAGAELERERVRADMRTAEAQRAQARATSAQAQAATAQERATVAQSQAGAARQQAAAADLRASGAQQQTALAQADAAQAQAQSDALQRQIDELQAKQTERGLLVTLGDVLFEFNRSEVKPGAQVSLRKLADFLQQHPRRQVLIEGYTDSVGSASVNEALSLRRADAVDAALVAMGVPEARVATAGYGESYPIADNTTPTNRALNRRVEIYIAEDDQAVKPRR